VYGTFTMCIGSSETKREKNNIMFCSNCGTENPETSSFCSKCGERTNGSTYELLKKQKQARQSVAIMSAFIIGLMTVAVFLNLVRHAPLFEILLNLLAILIGMSALYLATRNH
jgi:predicted amidophosphoribosyltransferase